MLGTYRIYVDLPVSDLDRARMWYAAKLGLTPVAEAGGGLLYLSGGVPLYMFRSPAAGSARITAVSWLVDDLRSVMADLRSRGVRFQQYSVGDEGPSTVNGVVHEATGGSATWFKDSEGNTLSITQLPRGIHLPGVNSLGDRRA